MNKAENPSFLKKLVWLYFILLIFEGALRKWVFPDYANYLLLVRDPVVLLLYIGALGQGLFPNNALVWIGALLGLLCLAAGLMAENNQLQVALYGWRSNFLHLPLIFLLPNIFNFDDVVKMGRWMIIIAFPMTILVVVQFLSPTSDIINYSVGGGEGNMMAGGHVRPPGTFSFTTGLVSFAGLLSCFVFWPLVGGRGYGRTLHLLGILCLVIMLSTSGSRSAVVEVLVVVVGLLSVWFFQGKIVGQLMKYVPLLVLIVGVLSLVSFVGKGVEVLNDRFSEGGAGGLITRVLAQFMTPFELVDKAPLLGYGLGVGTNVGAVIRTGNRDFLLAEGEWPRIILESGFILGFTYLMYRVAISIQLIRTGFQAMSRNNGLAPMLCILGAMHVAIDQFGQATALGFSVLIAALGMTAAQGNFVSLPGIAPDQLPGRARPFSRSDQPPETTLPDWSGTTKIPSTPNGETKTKGQPRGRSVYARRLHGIEPRKP